MRSWGGQEDPAQDDVIRRINVSWSRNILVGERRPIMDNVGLIMNSYP